VCTVPCKWSCGEIIGPMAKRSYHESHICLNRLVECSNGCGIQGVPAKYIEEHEKNQCRLTQLVCPNNCGEIIKRHELNFHLNSVNDKACPERLVKCPSNSIGWKILYLGEFTSNTSYEPETGFILKYERQSIEKTYLSSTLNLAGIDRIFVRFHNRHQWLSFWNSKIIYTEKLNHTSYIDCGYMTFSNVNNHLKCLCANRPVHILTEKEQISQTSELKDKETPKDDDDEVPSYNGQGQGQSVEFRNAKTLAIKRIELERYQDAPSAQINCNNCGEIMDKTLLDEHLKKSCSKVFRWCKLGCGTKLQLLDIDNHLMNVCPKRDVSCKLCDEKVWAEDMEEHLADTCVGRVVECLNQCGIEDLTFRDRGNHMIYDCINREIVCDCGLAMMFKERSDHIIAECTKKKGNKFIV